MATNTGGPIKSSYALNRAAGFALLLVGVGIVLGVRVAAGPSTAGLRTAMTSARGGQLYVAQPGRGLLLVSVDGARVIGPLPPGTPLALAASGGRILLGTDAGLYVSPDGGRAWAMATVPSGRYLAVALRGAVGYAGGWGARLWLTRDGGATWSAAATPEGDQEYQSIVVGETGDLVATLLGVLVSTDHRSWTAAPLPNRMTAVDEASGYYLAAGWHGQVYRSRDGDTWQAIGGGSGGVWSVDAATLAVATTDGLFVAGIRNPTVGHREVTAVASSNGTLYAALAQGPILVSADQGRSWRAALQR